MDNSAHPGRRLKVAAPADTFQRAMDLLKWTSNAPRWYMLPDEIYRDTDREIDAMFDVYSFDEGKWDVMSVDYGENSIILTLYDAEDDVTMYIDIVPEN